MPAIKIGVIDRVIAHAEQALASGDPSQYLDKMTPQQRDEFDENASRICDMAGKLMLESSDDNDKTKAMAEIYETLRIMRAAGFIDCRKTTDFKIGESVIKDGVQGCITQVDNQLGCIHVAWENGQTLSEQPSHIKLGHMVKSTEEVVEANYAMDEFYAKTTALTMPPWAECKVVDNGITLTLESEEKAREMADLYGIKLTEAKKRKRHGMKSSTISFAPVWKNSDTQQDSKPEEITQEVVKPLSILEAYTKAIAQPVYRGAHSDMIRFSPSSWTDEKQMLGALAEVAHHDIILSKALEEAVSAQISGAMAPVYRLAKELGAEHIVKTEAINESTSQNKADQEIEIESIAIDLRNEIRDVLVSQPGASIQEAEEIARIAVSDHIVGLCASDPEQASERISEIFSDTFGKPTTFSRISATIREAIEKLVPKGKKLKTNRTVRVKIARQSMRPQGSEQVLDLDALKQLDDSMTSIQSSLSLVKGMPDNRKANRDLATDILGFYNLLSIHQGEPWNPVRMRQQESVGDWSGVLEIEAVKEEEENGKPVEKTQLALGFVKPSKAIEKQGDGMADLEKIEELKHHVRRIKNHLSSLLGNPESKAPVKSLLVSLRKFFQFLVTNEKQPWNTLFKVSA